jgi:hypothetical protein
VCDVSNFGGTGSAAIQVADTVIGNAGCEF